MSVAPEVRGEPEVEMRPEPEITTCEGSLGATRSHPTDTALFTFAEIVTAHASQEVTETGLISTEVPSQTSPSHNILMFRSSTYCTDVRLSCHNKRILLVLIMSGKLSGLEQRRSLALL